MAKRILPYRDYSEHDVVNLFALDVSDAALSSYSKELTDFVEAEDGVWSAGVVVSVYAGELPGDLPDTRAATVAATDKLQKYMTGANLSNAHVGFNAYPSNGMTVRAAGVGSRGLGITLRETLAFDENGEKLLYYKQKLDEAQAVLPGKTVPVLTKGLVLLTAGTAGTSIPGGATIGHDLVVGAEGTLVNDDPSSPSGEIIVGSVIAKSGTDKVLCKLSF
jgi:hypothetical protein